MSDAGLERRGWDYIIVGAGSAGCVLAERLSADGKSQVLLLEAGADPSIWSRIPKGIPKVVADPDKIWAYPVTRTQPGGGTSEETWIRGRGLGGSSSVNGMIWTRGEPADYDCWEDEHGATGWNGRTMMQAFLELEDHALGAAPARGEGGKVFIDPSVYSFPLTQTMIAAGAAIGLEPVTDLNGSVGPRTGLYSHNIRKGCRQSAYVTHLAGARTRRNLTVLTSAQAERIILEDGKASGLAVTHKGEPWHFRCDGEVIVCAGAIESPLLLQRSGIGPAGELASNGIDPVFNAPQVGRNLTEHLSYSLAFGLAPQEMEYRKFYGLGLISSAIKYLLTRKGVLATGPFEVGGFDNVYNPDGRVDAQYYLGAYMFDLGDDNNPVPHGGVAKRAALTIHSSLLRLTSRGSIKIGGPTSEAPPVITPNFLSTEHDCQSAIAIVRRMRELAHAKPFKGVLREEIRPGVDVSSDVEVLDHYRRFATCGLHAVGTCAMGGSQDAVCDPQLKVRGVEGLRVVDCSVMPAHMTGNTNAPAMAVAQMAASKILNERR